MGIEIEGVAEALNEADSAATGFAVGCGNAGPAANRGKNSAHEDLCDISDQRRIIGKTVAKGIRNRKHPLPDWDFGKYMVDEMSRRIGHAPPATRLTKGAFFTRERNNMVQAAGIAVRAPQTGERCDHAPVAGAKKSQYFQRLPGKECSLQDGAAGIHRQLR
jgi:hypothetical protein